MTLSPARRDYDKREDYRLLQRPRKINNNTQSKRERKEKEEKEEEKKRKGAGFVVRRWRRIFRGFRDFFYGGGHNHRRLHVINVKPADVLRGKSSPTKGTCVAQKITETLLAEYMSTRDRVR